MESVEDSAADATNSSIAGHVHANGVAVTSDPVVNSSPATAAAAVPPTLIADQTTCTGDHSLLMKPIRLRDSAIRTIVDCVRNGTPEVRDLLATECELILECRVCRSLHRSLANFIAHKRVYCREHFCESMPLFEHADDVATVVQPESPVPRETVTASTDETPSNQSPNEDGDSSCVDESVGRTEILVSPHRIYRPLVKDRRPVSEFLDGILKNLKERNDRRSGTSVTLSNIDGNPNAVFQKTPFVDGPDVTSKAEEDSIDPRVVEGRDSVETVKTDISMDVCAVVTRSSELPSPPVSPLPPPPPPPPPAPIPFIPFTLSILRRPPTPPRPPSPSLLTHSLLLLPPPPPPPPPPPLHPHLRPHHAFRRVPSTSASRPMKSPRIGRPVNERIASVPCIKCRTLFTSVKTLIVHLKSVHSKTRVYHTCIFCENKFANSWAVGRHILRIHKRSKLQVDKLKDRIQQRAFQNVLQDRNSSDESDTEAETVVRRPNFSGRRPRIGSSKSRVSDVRSRVDKEDESVAVRKCRICKKAYSNVGSLRNHQKVCHAQMARRKADAARRARAQPTTNGRPKRIIKRPNESVDLVNTVASPSSKKGRRNKKVVRRANRRVTPVANSPVTATSLSTVTTVECDKCGLKFSNLSNCRRHVAKHIGLNRYKCNHCDYQSYHRYHVCYHMRSAHPREVAGKTSLALKNSLVDVEPPRSSSSASSSNERSGTKDVPKKRVQTPPTPSTSGLRPPSTTGFNISTRRHPRVFDTTPYRRPSPEDVTTTTTPHRRGKPKTTLATRSGRYTKVGIEKEATTAVRRRVVVGGGKITQPDAADQVVNGIKTEAIAAAIVAPDTVTTKPMAHENDCGRRPPSQCL